jgi:hypothetical protein
LGPGPPPPGAPYPTRAYVAPGNGPSSSGSSSNGASGRARKSPPDAEDPENPESPAMRDILEKYAVLEKEIAGLKKELAKKGR